jgi:hypothetical protein
MTKEIEVHRGDEDTERNTVKKREAEGEAGAFGLIFAVVYGTGLCTSNVFLTQYGIRDFSLVKPKAFFVGAIVLGTIALISSGPMALIARYMMAAPAAKVPRPIKTLRRLG